MSHKLDISLTIESEEILAQSNFKILFTIKNIDSVPFQGQVSKLSVQFSTSSASYSEEDFPHIPRINPGDTVSLPVVSFYASEEGTGWVNLQLRTNDGENALHYSGKQEFGNEWYRVIHVKNPETVKMTFLLEEILKEIKKLGSAPGGST